MAVIYGKSNKWTKTSLTYKFTNSVAGKELDQQEAVTEFQKACDLWKAPTGLTFSETTSNNADILVTWAQLDGSGDVLAQSGTPDGNDSQITMKFDTAEEWTDNNVLLTATNFLSVALHELGHAIGLGHSGNPDAVMYPFSTDLFAPKIKLDSDDIAGAEFLYKNNNQDMMIANETDKSLSWFAFNSNDLTKWVALKSGDMVPGEIIFYDPVKNGTGKYFIRITQRGGGTELAGATVSKDNLLGIYSVGSSGIHIQIS